MNWQLQMHWHYLKYVVRHKIEVFKAGRKLGVGFWRLLVHDLSKFAPSEWRPYAMYFYGPGPVAEDSGSGNALWRRCVDDIQRDFDHAWNHHQKSNKHHYQHYILIEDSGKVKVLEMPLKYVKELVADWEGMSATLTHAALRVPGDTKRWYEKNKENMDLHPNTRKLIEALLECV